MAIRSGKSDFIPLAKSRTVFYMKRHMVIGRGKTNRTRSKGFCQRFKEDLISQLPDHLICHILSLLSTKEAVKTSVLSTRWRSLWLWLPSFELKSRDFSDFNTVLVSLDDAEFVFLPFLKTMHLEYIEFPNESTFETLVLCCPVLEDIKIVVANDDAKVFRVHSRSLRRLTFERVSSFLLDSAGVVIDTPRLCFLSINDNISKSFIVDNLESIAILDMSLVFGLEKVTNLDEFDDPVLGEFDEASVSWMRSSICSFLRGISRVTDMRICARTFKLICQYSKLEPLPQFGYMPRLHMTICISSFKWLPTFLESFPNLKFLNLVCVVNCEYAEDIEEVSFSSVPECLLSSLEFVEFIAPIQYFVERKLVKYLLKNSAILKKLTLPLASYGRKDDIFKKLLKIPRGSTKCKDVIL